MRNTAAGWLVAGWVLLPIAVAAATIPVGELYQARAIVTGQEGQARTRGIAACLEDVLVKVSGDPRLIDDARTAVLAEHAEELVESFRYRDRMTGIPVHDEQGTRDRPYDLTVDFDPPAIDAALYSLGRKPWSASRPTVAMFLNVRNGSVAYALARDGERGCDLREALAAASWKFGLPLALPDSATLADVPPGEPGTRAADLGGFETAAQRTGGDVALLGWLTWDEANLGWVAEWRLPHGGELYRWQVGGVSFDAAFRSAVSGAAQILSGNGRPD